MAIINGTAAGETLPGTAAADTITGAGGNDKALMGAGNDLFLWAPGHGSDTIEGGTGNDTVAGGTGNDSITVSLGNDVVRYTSVLDGHDVIIGFDGNVAGGQDTLDLDALFDSLGVALVDRAARVSITDTGASVAINVDTEGNGSFDLAAVILKTSDVITVGQDIVV